jgi:small-conductance mechanosensitive channel
MSETINAILEKVYFSNRVLDYVLAIAFFLVSFIVIKIIRRFLVRKFIKFATSTKTTFDDFLASLLDKLIVPFSYCVCLYAALKYLTLPVVLDKGINVASMAILTFFAVRFLLRLIGYGFTIYWQRTSSSEALVNSLRGILKVIKFLAWSFAIIFFLDNLGFKVSTVIAGLGIGGVAIALAAQALLGDLFSYFSIIFDRPFEVGDFIIIGDLMGVVEHVGIKTTRIRSLGGEQLIFSNSDLTNSRVRNYKRMQKRRVVFKLGVVYQTPIDQLKEIPVIIEKAIKSLPEAAFDRAHFFEYGDFSLIYEVVYYVLSGDYNKYMDTQQKINFIIAEEFKDKAIEFAYPTQTVFVQK